MKILFAALSLVLFSTPLAAKPGAIRHSDIFSKSLIPDVPATERPGVAAAAPEDEATRYKKIKREWEAYNRLIGLYLADHPKFKILPDAPEVMRETITSPDAVKRIEGNIQRSVDAAAIKFKAGPPEQGAAAVEAYKKKITEQYRWQIVELYRAAMLNIATTIKFKELNKLKMKYETNQDRKDEFAAIVAERQAFNFRATDNFYWQLVTEESEGKPVYPKGTAEEKASMEELWNMVETARQAEIDREDKLQREGK